MPNVYPTRTFLQRGLTLVELLVALALGTLITLAAIAALTVCLLYTSPSPRD